MTGTLHEDLCTYISRWILLKWEMFQTKVVQKIKTHFMFNNVFFTKIVPLYEKMCKNIVEPDGHQIIRRSHSACWIPKATDTHTQNHTYCHSTATMVMHSRLNVSFVRTWPVLFLIKAIINSPRLHISDRQQLEWSNLNWVILQCCKYYNKPPYIRISQFIFTDNYNLLYFYIGPGVA
jgi:hypothetical protein